MTDKKTQIEFPCHFPIKIIGTKTSNFLAEITDIARRHFPEIKESSIVLQESKKGNYLSITVTIYAEDQQTLDALYNELTKHPNIKMVL